jgi:hypothetical protein
MAKKASLKTISAGFASNTQLNSNFEALNNKLDNTLSLDGSTPNAMGADLDLNGNDIINVGSFGFEGGETLQDYVDGAAASAAAAAQSALDATTNGEAQVANGAAQVALATTQANNAAASATAVGLYETEIDTLITAVEAGLVPEDWGYITDVAGESENYGSIV